MKQAIKIFFIMGICFSCAAQTPVLPLTSDNYGDIDNAYFKDLDGDLQELVGTWLYTNGSKTFEVIIKKKEQEIADLSYPDITFYEDILYGEYRYVDENGMQTVNSLANINGPNLMSFDHLIWGNYILTAPSLPPTCQNCPLGERRVQLTLTDPQRSYLPIEITLRVLPDPFDQYPEERMEMVVEWTAHLTFVDPGQPTDYRIPQGTYVFIKQ